LAVERITWKRKAKERKEEKEEEKTHGEFPKGEYVRRSIMAHRNTDIHKNRLLVYMLEE